MTPEELRINELEAEVQELESILRAYESDADRLKLCISAIKWAVDSLFTELGMKEATGYNQKKTPPDAQET